MRLSEGIAGYLAHKRETGLKYRTEEVTFKAFLLRVGDLPLSQVVTADVIGYLDNLRSNGCSWRAKYQVLACFFEFWAVREVIEYVRMPPPRPAQPRTHVPHIYSRDEVRSLLRGCGLMKPRYEESIAPQTLRTFLLFLYATGAGVGEAKELRAADIQWRNRSVVIRHNRYNAARNVPLCPDLMTALDKYRRWKLRRGLDHEFFFLKNDAKPLARGTLSITFRRLCLSVHVRRPDGGPATMKDLRPTFAVHRIKSWIRNGADLNRLLPALSVYMGHGGLYAAQKYLVMTPERFRSQLNKLTSVRKKGRWKENRELMAFLGSLS